MTKNTRFVLPKVVPARGLVWLLAALLGLIAGGCGAGAFRAPIRNAGAALSGDVRAERLALGAIDPDLATDPEQEVARLRRVAALEERAGNFGLAIEATLRALQIARARAVLASDADRPRAQDLHRQMRDEAISVADRTGSLELALEAVGRADPGGARDVIARLVRARADAGGSLAGLTLAEPLTRALQPAERLDFERLGAELSGEPLSLERLAPLGTRALPRLHQLLAAAARRGDSQRLGSISRAIRALDPWDPTVRTLGYLEHAQRLDLALEVVRSSAPSGQGQAIARLSRAHRADADDFALALALAEACREAHLEGDALESAREALALASDDEQRRTAELIAALAQAVDGNGQEIADWVLANDHDQRSIAIARAVAPLGSIAHVSAGLRARASAAVRLLVREGVGDPSLAFQVAIDRTIPDEERTRALDALWVADRAAARIAAQCATERATLDVCEARFELMGEAVWWDGRVPTGAVPDLDETALPSFELAVGDDHVAAASAWVDSAASSRLAIAPSWIRARIVLAARHGDLSAARAVLAADGALLTGATRIALATWLDDLAAGRTVEVESLDDALALGPAVTRFATWPIDAPHLEVTEIDGNTQRLVAADFHLTYDAWRADSLRRLRPLLDGASDRDGAVIAGWMGAAVDRDARERGGSTAALESLSERAGALAPESAVERLLEALRLANEGDAAAARDALARVLVLAPTSPVLQMRWLAAWSDAEPGAAAEEARSLLFALDPLGLSRTVATGEASDVGDLVDLYGVYLPTTHADAVLRGGARMARAEGAWDAIESLLRARIALGPDAGADAPGLDTLLALVEAAAPSAARRRWLVRLRILERDVDGAITAADAPEPQDAELGSDPPLLPEDRLRAIARARAELFDPLAWGLVAEDELGDDAETLARLRARARTRPELEELTCGELARTQGFTPVTMETCLSAWRRFHGPIAATVLARALVEAPDAAWAHELVQDDFFADARRELGEHIPGALLHQEAVLLERRAQRGRAVDAETEAQARGWIPEAWGTDGPRMRRGLVVRAQRARPVSPRWSELSLLALGDARIVAARLYADAAIASLDDDASDRRIELAYTARDLVEWASADLAAGKIDGEGVETFERARLGGFAGDETERLVSLHPESSLVAYGATVRAIRAGRREDALRSAEVVLHASPRPTIVRTIAPVVEEVRGHTETETLRSQARTAFPDDPPIDRPVVDVVPQPSRARTPVVVGRGAEGCSLTRELASAGSDAARATILREAFRTAPDEASRLRVLACAAPAPAVATAEAPPESTVVRAEEHRPAPSLAERRRLAAEEEAAHAAEAQRLAEEERRRALEGERRATEADARRAEAEARLAEAERRVAEAERRAAATRPRVAAADPTATAASEAELRAAEAERRVADAERRALEAEARAALAERTAIEEARRIAAATAVAEAAVGASSQTPSTTHETAVAAIVAEPAPTVTTDAGVASAPLVAETPTTSPPITTTTPTPIAETPLATTPSPIAEAQLADATVPVADTTVPPSTTAEAPAAPTAPATPPRPEIRMLAQLPPQTAAQAEALAAEADQRVAMSEARLAEASARATDAETLAAESGRRASYAELRAVEGEQRVVEAETRAAEAEVRAAEASHRLEAAMRAAEPTAVVATETPTTTATAAVEATASPTVEATASASTDATASATVPEAVPAYAGGLGLAAVLDADPEAYRRGVALAMLDPDGALVAAREIVQASPSAGSSGADSLPPFGTVQALVGLPLVARRTLAAEMMNGSDRQRRLLALAAEQVLPGTVDVDALRRAIEGDDAGLAIEAVRAHGARPEPVELDAMRMRLDAMHAPLAAPDRELVRALVHALAGALDARDRGRIADAATLVRTGLAGDAAGEAAARAIEHDAALYLAARARGIPRDPSLAPEVERMRRARLPNLPSAEAVRLLATEPLSRVLTGSAWRYARVAQPSAFVTAMTGGATDPAIARAARSWLDENGGSELVPEGGLDLDRPIECAQADSGSRSWVCVAFVRDRDRVRASLARRAFGGHSGAWLALGAGELARGLPTLSGAAPLAIDRILEAPPTSSGALAFAERARAEVDLGGVVVERYATLERRDDRTTEVDAELYLFTGDRVVVFGDEEMARAVVGRPPTAARSLGRSARFRRITGVWTGGPTLEVAALDWRIGGDLPLVTRRDSSIVMAADTGGISVTMRSPFTEPRRDIVPLSSLLPEDTVAIYALGANAPRAVRARGRAQATRALEGRAEVGRVLLREAERVAFAWMPHTGDGLWDRWVAIGEGPRLDAALASAGIARGADGEVASYAGTFVARRGARWIIAPVEDDLRAALARPEVAADPRTMGIGSARLDGARGASATRGLVDGLPVGDPRRAALEALGARIAATGEIAFDARVESRQLVLVTRVRPASE